MNVNLNVEITNKCRDDDKQDAYRDNIRNHIDEINLICTKLCSVNDTDINEHFIESIIDDIGVIFTSCAKSTFGIKSAGRKTNNKNSFKQPWFNVECRIARKCCRKAKRLYKKYKTVIFKEDLDTKGKEYKKKTRLIQQLANIKPKHKIN